MRRSSARVCFAEPVLGEIQNKPNLLSGFVASLVTGRVGTPTRDVPGHLSEKRARIPPLALALLGSLPVIYFARRANLRPTTHLHAKT
eukprot:4956266-Pyramimonas_sp.AAC.3